MRKRSRRGALAPLAGRLLVGLILVSSAQDLRAQTPIIPYYGKNQIHYDTFEWFTYKTDHFEIYYYPDIEQHLERVASCGCGTARGTRSGDSWSIASR